MSQLPLSPGVVVTEFAQTAAINNFSSSSAGLVGSSPRGRLTVGLMTNTNQFLNEYTVNNQVPLGSNFHYSALAYLAQGNQLYVQRVVHSDILYGGARIKISTSAQANAGLSVGVPTTSFTSVSGNQDCFEIFGCNPGVWDNSISVVISNVSASQYTFDIVVYFTDANGNANAVETWTVSRQVKLDGYGNQLYLETKINGFSQYIVVADNTSYANTILPKAQASLLALSGGTDGSTVTDSDVATGWGSFTNPDDIQVRILINAGYTGGAVQAAMLALVVGRKDCIGVFDIPLASTGTSANAVTWRTGTQNYNNDAAAVYSPWVKINDQWNNQIVNVPPSGYVAGAYAFNDAVGNVWDSPAGFERGLLNVLGVSTVYTQGDRDILYTNQINAIQLFRGAGVVIYGDKSEATTNSVTSHLNVRRFLIVLEKSIRLSLSTFLFANNTELTRNKVTGVITQYLAGLAAGNAFNPIGPNGSNDKGYEVVCNTTNNTPSVINNHQLVVDVYIRPVQSINFIQLNINILDSTVSIQTLTSNGTLI